MPTMTAATAHPRTTARPTPLAKTLEALRKRVDRALEAWLPLAEGRHKRLHEAMRYSVLGGGKRLRPCLALLAAELVGGNAADALPAACALEMIHTYSLIHDDLPAMDDDDFRRGRRSNHKVFGEAMAILAGDGLLTLAFETVARRTRDRARVGDLVRAIAEGAGHDGMVGGQVVDISSDASRPDAELLEHLHARKTAALIRASVVAGAIAGRASAGTLRAVARYGLALGMAFQITDDVLDEVGDSRTLGKTAGKDREANKLTYPALLGVDRSRAAARAWAERAKRALDRFGSAAGTLRALADWVVERMN